MESYFDVSSNFVLGFNLPFRTKQGLTLVNIYKRLYFLNISN